MSPPKNYDPFLKKWYTPDYDPYSGIDNGMSPEGASMLTDQHNLLLSTSPKPGEMVDKNGFTKEQLESINNNRKGDKYLNPFSKELTNYFQGEPEKFSPVTQYDNYQNYLSNRQDDSNNQKPLAQYFVEKNQNIVDSVPDSNDDINDTTLTSDLLYRTKTPFKNETSNSLYKTNDPLKSNELLLL